MPYDDPDLEFDCLDCGRHVTVWNINPEAREHRCVGCMWLRDSRDAGTLTHDEEMQMRLRLGLFRL